MDKAADASRPVARRTYGRARPTDTPSTTDEVSSLVHSSTDTMTTASTMTASPAKNLLDTFTKRSTDWLGATRAGLSAEPSSDTARSEDNNEDANSGDGGDSDDDFSPEAVEAYMAKMRKEARTSRPAPAAGVNGIPRVSASSHPLFASSSLSELPPTSPTPQSKSVVSSPKTSRKLAPSQDKEHDKDDAPPSSQPQTSTQERVETAVTAQESSTPLSPIRATAPRRNRRVIASDSDSSGSDDNDAASRGSLTPRARPVASRHSSVTQSRAANESDDSDDGAQRQTTPRNSNPNPTGLGLFSDNDDDQVDEPQAVKSGQRLKQLGRADQIAMRQDIARAERERPVMASRPEPKRRPVSQWMAKAQDVVNTTSQPSKSPQLTSDDIQQFPSSGPNNGKKGRATGPVSSPTPCAVDKLVAISSLPSHDQNQDQVHALRSRETEKEEEHQKRLLAFKNAALAKKSKGKEKATPALELDLDDDDLSIIPAKGKLTFTPSHRKVPDARGADARGVLSRSSAVPAPTRTRQNVMKWSGKRAKQDVTETHIDFAGRQFGHAELKRNNAGARPAGQKKGRDEIISQAQVDQQMLARHKKQVRMLAKTKEERFGPGRNLPEKHALDITELVRSSNEETDLVAESDADDSDFAPTGEEDEGAEVAEAEAEGSDDERVSAVQGTHPDELDDVNDDNDADKENQPAPPAAVDDEDDEDDNPFRVSARPSARNRRRVASDDEGETEPVRDMSLREAIKKPAAAAKDVGLDLAEGFDESDGLDLAGFGSTGGGFSQLFGATQAPAGDDGGDAFAAIRNAPIPDIFPAQDLLPGVDISETQKRRDNALIAAEFENSAGPTPKSVSKKQYLNSQGFFTQTRPAGRDLTQADSVGDLEPVGEVDEDDSPVGSRLVKSSSTLLNSTTDIPSPTNEEEQSFSRLRRRTSPDAEEATSPRELSPSPVKKPKSRNAFDILQRGATREAEKAQRLKEKSAWVDEQAEESDEDNGWGMGMGGGDDDEEDEDLDTGYVPELLDDKEVDEEEKLRQAELAATKFREVEQADDARREAEAKKVIEGHHRIKRRGNDFLSDEEDDEEGRPRLTKRQRKERRLAQAKAVLELGDEANVFVDTYDEDLDTDNEIEEDDAAPAGFMSPDKQVWSAQERQDMLRARARMNESESLESSLFADDAEESQYSISNKTRLAAPAPQNDDQDEQSWNRGTRVMRSFESYSKIVSEESSNPRRVGAAAVSVVMAKTEVVSRNSSSSVRAGGGVVKKTDARSITRQGSSILLERTKRFGE